MDLAQFIKPELAVLLPILCFMRSFLKRCRSKKKEMEAFFVCFALLISVGYVLSTSQIENSQDFFQCVWLGVSQGIVILAVCSFLNCKTKNPR